MNQMGKCLFILNYQIYKLNKFNNCSAEFYFRSEETYLFNLILQFKMLYSHMFVKRENST